MIWRLMLLGLVAAGAWGGWWALTETHRRRLRTRVSSEPHTAVVFTSPGCPGCRTQERIIESLPREVARRIRSVDVTIHREEAARFGVMTVPTTVFFGPDGDVSGTAYGVTGAEDFRRSLIGK